MKASRIVSSLFVVLLEARTFSAMLAKRAQPIRPEENLESPDPQLAVGRPPPDGDDEEAVEALAPPNQSAPAPARRAKEGHPTDTAVKVESWLGQMFNLKPAVGQPAPDAGPQDADSSGIGVPPTQEATAADGDGDSSGVRSDTQLTELPADASRENGKTGEGTAASNASPSTGKVEGMETLRFGYRTWVDDTGRYRAVARIVAVEGDTVRLRKKNGRSATVPLDRLSPDDVRYVRRWLKATQ